MKESIETITELLGLISAIIGLIAILLTYKKSFFDRFGKQPDFETILKLDLPDEVKDIYIEERNRCIFKKLKGVDILTKNQILLCNLYTRLNDEYSWNQIRVASRYFKYDDGEITITIKKMEWFSMIIFLILASMLIAVGFISFYLNKAAHDYNVCSVIKNIFFILSPILLGIYVVDRFVAPIHVAKMIDRSMKKINHTQVNPNSTEK